jgi:cytochrome c peroxidase
VLRGLDSFTPDEYKGYIIVNDQSMGNCLHCHVTDAHALGTSGGFANNGLDAATQNDKGVGGITLKDADNGKFKIPSLRNLSYTHPYMHDGRIASIEDVIDFYSNGVQPHPQIDSKMAHVRSGGMQFSEEEKRQILAFLKTMDDPIFADISLYDDVR